MVLERNESVTVLYHGKVRGIIKPVKEKLAAKVESHAFFVWTRGLKELCLKSLGT